MYIYTMYIHTYVHVHHAHSFVYTYIPLHTRVKQNSYDKNKINTNIKKKTAGEAPNAGVQAHGLGRRLNPKP